MGGRLKGVLGAALLAVGALACATPDGSAALAKPTGSPRAGAEATESFGAEVKRAARGAAMLSLLSMAYYCDHGDWPESLAELEAMAEKRPELVASTELEVEQALRNDLEREWDWHWSDYRDVEVSIAEDGGLVFRFEAAFGSYRVGAVPRPECDERAGD